MPTLPEFAGFPPEAFDFYARLADDDNNAREWFDANRDVYERAVRLPMEALLARADDEGWGDGKVFRPNRDVRFSKDKRPYKTHCGAVIAFRDGTGRASNYVQLDAEGMMAGCGYWELSRDQLDRLRRAVDDQRHGTELVRLVDAARGAGVEVLGSELKRAPRGYAADHPRIELLRHTRLAASRRWPVQPWMHTAEAYDRVTGLWREAAPIAVWLETHVGAAVEPRRPRGG
ncbi:DUF2461 domain-containing protein [Egicoccus sp. AB-alg2]|uniref:DUF2461 domain-containing protein n=1 Tax=Egicoccus sp. AB-alg2 TaxID=3242693 RepID=UPI00359E10C6